LHFDSPLIDVDLLNVQLREWDQRLFIVPNDFQNLSAARIDNAGNGSNVLAVSSKNSATLQLKRVIRTLLCCGQRIRRNFDFAANVSFGFRNRIDSPEFYDAAPMLPSKNLDFRLACGSRGGRKYDRAPGFEHAIVFEQLLDSDFAFQTLGFGDPSDGNVGDF